MPSNITKINKSRCNSRCNYRSIETDKSLPTSGPPSVSRNKSSVIINKVEKNNKNKNKIKKSMNKLQMQDIKGVLIRTSISESPGPNKTSMSSNDHQNNEQNEQKPRRGV